MRTLATCERCAWPFQPLPNGRADLCARCIGGLVGSADYRRSEPERHDIGEDPVLQQVVKNICGALGGQTEDA